MTKQREGFMKLGKIICLVVLSILTIASLSYAYTAMVNVATQTDGKGVAAKTAGTVAGETQAEQPTKTGSSLHAWVDVINEGLTELDYAKFKEIRNRNRPIPWSERTLKREWHGLIAIGVFKPTDPEQPYGNNTVTVSPAEDVLARINEEVRGIVGKTGILYEGGRGAVGLEYYDLTLLEQAQKERIAEAISKATGKANVVVQPALDVQSEEVMAGGTITAALAINREEVEVISIKKIADGTSIAITPNYGPAVSLLVDLGLVSDEGTLINSTTSELPETQLEAALFKNEFVTSPSTTDEFVKRFNDEIKGDGNRIAIIVSNSEDPREDAIVRVLAEKGLIGYLGDKIFIIGVHKGSPADRAFERLFGKDGFVPDFKKAADLLNDQNTVDGLNGAV